jgi:hypothetical protein
MSAFGNLSAIRKVKHTVGASSINMHFGDQVAGSGERVSGQGGPLIGPLNSHHKTKARSFKLSQLAAGSLSQLLLGALVSCCWEREDRGVGGGYDTGVGEGSVTRRKRPWSIFLTSITRVIRKSESASEIAPTSRAASKWYSSSNPELSAMRRKRANSASLACRLPSTMLAGIERAARFI